LCNSIEELHGCIWNTGRVFLKTVMNELSSERDIPFGIVLYGGNEALPITEKIVAIPASAVL